MSREARIRKAESTGLGLERIVFFSDAVMAIAITLLAIDIRVPVVSPDAAVAQLPAQLLAMAPRFSSLVISFFIIGVYWLSHHRYFEFIRGYDRPLILLNLVFLLFIICVPFVTNLLGSYASVPLVYIIYSCLVAGMGLSMCALWAYATHGRRLVDPDLDARLIRETALRALFAPLVFVVSIPFALLSPIYAILIWCFSPVLTLLASRLVGRGRKLATYKH